MTVSTYVFDCVLKMTCYVLYETLLCPFTHVTVDDSTTWHHCVGLAVI